MLAGAGFACKIVKTGFLPTQEQKTSFKENPLMIAG